MRSTIPRSGKLTAHWLIAVVLAQTSLTATAHAGTPLEELAVRAGFRILSQGNSTGDVQKQAQAALPLQAMTPENRQRARAVVDKCNQFRRLPQLQYAADPAIYTYLLQHPDVAVSTWRVMGISRFEMWQTGPMEYEARATDGSEGLADILYRDQRNCVFVCEGRYHNPLLPKPLEASALVWFRHEFAPAANGTHVVTQEADVFVAFPSQGLSAVAKVLTPVTNSMMDRNMFEVSLYASLMSRAVRDEPEWVIQVAQQLEGVLPQRTNELIAVARQERGTSRTARAATAPAGNLRDRRQLLPAITLFESPQPEDLAAVPGLSAPPVPQRPAHTGPSTAASSSTATLLQPTSQPTRRVSTAAATSAGPAATTPAAAADMQIAPAVRSRKAMSTTSPDNTTVSGTAGTSAPGAPGGLALQPEVTPPATGGTSATRRSGGGERPLMP